MATRETRERQDVYPNGEPVRRTIHLQDLGLPGDRTTGDRIQESKPKRPARGPPRVRTALRTSERAKEGVKLTKHERRQRQLAAVFDVLRQAMAHSRKLYGKTVRDWGEVFRAIDRDATGQVSYDQFKQAMRRLGLGLSDTQITQLTAFLDRKRTGVIVFEELQRALVLSRRHKGACKTSAPHGAFGTPATLAPTPAQHAVGDRAAGGGHAPSMQVQVRMEPEHWRGHDRYGLPAERGGGEDHSLPTATTTEHETQGDGGGGDGGARAVLETSSLTDLGAKIAQDERALAEREAKLERDRRQLIERKRTQQMKRVERELRAHAGE